MIPKMFITDFDGTLLKDDKTISQKDLKTLEALRQKGILIVIATGRSAYSFEKALSSLDLSWTNNILPVDYVIFSTGAGIVDFKTRKIIFKKEIKAKDIKIITQYFDFNKFDYMVHQAIPETQYFLYKTYRSDNADFQSRMALYVSYSTPLEAEFSHLMPATQVLAIIPPGIMDAKQVAKIRTKLNQFSVIQATSPLDNASTWIEVFHKQVSKSLAVSWLCEKLNVARQNVVAVGNDYNDVDLLTWAKEGFVVGNAPVRLQQEFIVVCSNNEDGVSSAVKNSEIIGYSGL